MDINISIGYNAKNVLYDNIALSINKGEINNILGKNGTGKSTFYKTLMGKLSPISGSVPEDVTRNIAVISDYISVPPELKVSDVIKFMGNNQIAYMKSKFDNLTQIVFSLENHKVSELSTGQKRLIEIFTALSSKKSILILDEACNGLDYKNRDFFLENIHNLVKSNNISIFHTSHNLEDIIDLGGNVYVLDKTQKMFRKYDGNMSMDELSTFMKKID